MPPTEKDKLLFRLIAKDHALVQKLIFELLETGDTKELRRDELKENILQALKNYKNYYYSPGYLLLDLRSISGEINRHVKTTKDKYGEIELNFLMLNKSLEYFGEHIKNAPPRRSKTFNNYVVKRALKLLALLKKMHEDIVLDFQGPMKELGKHIGDSHNMMKAAIFHGLDVNWLLQGKVPR